MLTAWPKLRKFQRLGAQPPFPPHLTQNPKPSRNFDANSSTSNARIYTHKCGWCYQRSCHQQIFSTFLPYCCSYQVHPQQLQLLVGSQHISPASQKLMVAQDLLHNRHSSFLKDILVMNLTLNEGDELPDDTHLTISGGKVQCCPSLCIRLILMSTLLKEVVQTLKNHHKCRTQLLATSLAQLQFETKKRFKSFSLRCI